MLEHFAECMKMSKGQRLEAIQVNVYTALLLALRTLAETKSMLGQDPVKNIATELVIVRFYYYFYLFKRVVKAFIITLEFWSTIDSLRLYLDSIFAFIMTNETKPIRW